MLGAPAVVLALAQIKECDNMPCALNIDAVERLGTYPEGHSDSVRTLRRGHGDHSILSNKFLHGVDLLRLDASSMTLQESLLGVFVFIVLHVLRALSQYTIWPFSSLQ